MTYERPEISDFGNIAEHTYTGHDFCGASAQICDSVIEF